MPKAFTNQEREAIRMQMRVKSAKLFEKQGLKKTSVDEIVAATGISKGAFYLFYESKEELFLEVLEQIEHEIQTAILEQALGPKGNARLKVSRLLKSLLLRWDAYPLLKNLSKADFDYLVRKVPSERVQKHASNDEAFIREFVKKVKKEGIKVSAAPQVISGLIKSLFFISLHREDLGEETYRESINIMIDLVAGHIVGEIK